MMLILLRLLAIYLGGVPALAQTAAATHILSRGPGAEAAGLGNSVVSVSRGPSALYWNPAGLANSGGMVMGEHLFPAAGSRYNFTGLSVPSRLGAFGMGAIQFSRGNAIGRQAIDDPGERLSDTQTSFLVGFARRIGRYFAAGGSLNILHFDLAGRKDLALGLDLGGQAQVASADLWAMRQPAWSFGAVLKNLLEPKLRLAEEKEALPREMRMGLSLSFRTVSRPSMSSGVVRHDRLAALLSVRKASAEPGLRPNMGLSYSYEDLLVLRLGYDAGLAGGLGLKLQGGRFSVDYSVENRALARNHRFTLSYRFLQPSSATEEARETDEDYSRAMTRARSLSEEHLIRGKGFFKGPDYHKALEPLRLAALLDPEDHAKAELYRRAFDVSRREKLRRLGSEADQAHGKDDLPAAFKALGRLLCLGASEQESLAERFSRISSRLGPAASESAARQLLEDERAEALKFASAGLVSDALRIARGLEVLRAGPLREEVEALSAKLRSDGEALRARLEAEARTAGEAGDFGKAFRAWSALRRAFPDDPEIAGQAEAAASRARAKVALSVKERLYLRRLYLLAAVQYANGNAESARDMIEEVLRRDPADGPACALEDAISEANQREREVQ